MKVKELRALLENVLDDMDVFTIKDNMYVGLMEEDINIITLGAGNNIGPTVLVIAEQDEQY